MPVVLLTVPHCKQQQRSSCLAACVRMVLARLCPFLAPATPFDTFSDGLTLFQSEGASQRLCPFLRRCRRKSLFDRR